MFQEERDLSLSPLISFSFLFFKSMNTYTLRDSWESIDIRGDEIGVLQKTQTCRRKKREGHK